LNKKAKNPPISPFKKGDLKSIKRKGSKRLKKAKEG